MLNLATKASFRVIHQSAMATMNILVRTSDYKQFIHVNCCSKLVCEWAKNQPTNCQNNNEAPNLRNKDVIICCLVRTTAPLMEVMDRYVAMME
jgi:hypothetical protein